MIRARWHGLTLVIGIPILVGVVVAALVGGWWWVVLGIGAWAWWLGR